MIGKSKQWDAVDSDNLAKFWLNISDVKARIENEILPYAEYQGVEADEMLQALELAASAVRQYQRNYRIQGGRNG